MSPEGSIHRRGTLSIVPIALLALAVVLVGTPLHATATTTASPRVTISLWTHTHPPMIAEFKKLIKEYERLHPNVTVQYQTIPNTDFATKMLTSMGTSTGPEIINMDDGQLRSIYIPKGLIVPVDPKALGYSSLSALKNAYVPHSLDGATSHGQVYGLPTEYDVTALAINTQEFAKAGLDPNAPPKTWDQLGAQGEQIVKKGVAQRGFDFLYIHAGWYHNELGTLLLQTGGRVASADGSTATINQPAAVRALQIWYDLIYKYHEANPNLASNDATVPYQDFIDGKMAMTMFNPWGLPTVTKGSAAYGHFKVVPLPQLDPAHPVNPVYAYYLAVNKQSKHQAEDFKFIRFVLSQTGDWLQNVNFIQPKKGWGNLPQAKALPFASVWNSELVHGQFIPVVPNAAQVDQIVKNAVDSSVLNKVPPAQAFATAAQQINAVLHS